MSDQQWYCHNCGIVDKVRWIATQSAYECAECEADITHLHPSVTALQARIAELEAEAAQARQTSQFHKDSLLAANATIAQLEAAQPVCVGALEVIGNKTVMATIAPEWLAKIRKNYNGSLAIYIDPPSAIVGDG